MTNHRNLEAPGEPEASIGARSQVGRVIGGGQRSHVSGPQHSSSRRRTDAGRPLIWHASCTPGGMGSIDRQRRIAILKRLVASERQLLDDPRYGFAAARVMAQARHELAVLGEAAPRHHRLAVATR
jgi:hypothetical protein